MTGRGAAGRYGGRIFRSTKGNIPQKRVDRHRALWGCARGGRENKETGQQTKHCRYRTPLRRPATMNLNVPVLDLSGVIAMLAAMGGVMGLLSMLRLLFLDRLLSGLNGAQQNIVLRAVLVALNFGAIVGLAL